MDGGIDGRDDGEPPGGGGLDVYRHLLDHDFGDHRAGFDRRAVLRLPTHENGFVIPVRLPEIFWNDNGDRLIALVRHRVGGLEIEDSRAGSLANYSEGVKQ